MPFFHPLPWKLLRAAPLAIAVEVELSHKRWKVISDGASCWCDGFAGASLGFFGTLFGRIILGQDVTLAR
jgi:hypothetical protein